MCPDLQAIQEYNYEMFIEKIDSDIDFRNEIYYTFAEPLEYYMYCKDDAFDESIIDGAFDALWNFDADLFHEDMNLCVASYIEHLKMVKEFRREWELSRI